MLATTVNIPAATAASFTIRTMADGSVVASESSATEASSVQAPWLSAGPGPAWPGPQLMFHVVAGGAAADSQPEQLSFHQYPDAARTLLSGSMQSPPAPAPATFGWDKKVSIEFTERALILTVQVHLVNRTEARPERGKKESYPAYYARCQATPVGGPVPAEAKTAMKNGIESVYRDKWLLHRRDCGRGDGCSCDLANRCCKFPVGVNVEFVEAPGAAVQEVNLWPGTGRASSNDWYRIESRPGKSWPHEVGHLMGFYDEYRGGATGPAPWQADAPTSIMGSGTGVFDYHLEEFRRWVSAQLGEEFKLLRR